jgi:ACS family tartrate transporter-like MFS transporter
MNDDLKFSATIYGLAAACSFLGYALFEIPSNLMLVGSARGNGSHGS